MSQRLQDPSTGLFRHSWYEGNEHPAFYWGRGAGWGLMAAAELLSVLPEDHAARGRVLEIFQRGGAGRRVRRKRRRDVAPTARQER